MEWFDEKKVAAVAEYLEENIGKTIQYWEKDYICRFRVVDGSMAELWITRGIFQDYESAGIVFKIKEELAIQRMDKEQGPIVLK